MPQNPPPDTGHLKPNWPLLAGMRFVLALIVALYHVSFVLRDGTYEYYRALGPTSAVTVFFVISGYSMRHSFEKEPRGFYRRRFWRIAPTYWLACGAALLPFLVWGRTYTMPISFSETTSFRMMPLWHYLPVLVGLFPSGSVVFNSALWSMGVEIAFYAVVPLIANAKRELLWCLLVISFGLHSCLDIGVIWFSYVSYLGFFLLGWMTPDYQRSRRFVVCCAILMSLSGILAAIHHQETMGPFLRAFGWIFVAISPYVAVTDKIRRYSLIAGDLSYPLYALHSPLSWLMLPIYLPIAYSMPIEVVGYALVIAAIVLFTIDRPLRRFGREPLLRRRAAVIAVG